MASPSVKTFTDANFEADVLGVSHPVLVDFWAEWCQPCRALSPTIDALADEYDGRASIGKVDTDSNRETAMKFNITAIPTVLLFHGGELREKFVGMVNKDKLSKAIDALL